MSRQTKEHAQKKWSLKNIPARELRRQALRRAALCKQRIHFPPWYDSVAEWRPPLSDFPPSSRPPPSSYLTPSSHTEMQSKGIPHYLSFCLLAKHTARNVSSLLDISSHLHLDTKWDQSREKIKTKPNFYNNTAQCQNGLPCWWNQDRGKNNLKKKSLWVGCDHYVLSKKR